MLDSCGNRQHELQQLDYPPRTKLNHWALFLLSSLPLCNSCHPLNLPTCLSSPSPSPPFSLGALSCLFGQKGSAGSKLKCKTPLACIHGHWIQPGFRPSTGTSCFFDLEEVSSTQGVWPAGSFSLYLAADSRTQRSSRNTMWLIYAFIQQTSLMPGAGKTACTTESLLSGGLEAPRKMGTESSQSQLHRGTTWGAREIKILMSEPHPWRF